MTAQAARTPTPRAEFARTVVQVKPWGHEVLFADGAYGYVGKLLTVDAGHALSLQLHVEKDETLTVISGEARIEHGLSDAGLRARTLRSGDIVHVPPGVLHRITAVTDVVLAEVSTGAAGWREDVVRLADRYGRTGTTRP
jgi:mannose-6-phosphate isomerase-like protein (cupin superfamily)